MSISPSIFKISFIRSLYSADVCNSVNSLFSFLFLLASKTIPNFMKHHRIQNSLYVKHNKRLSFADIWVLNSIYLLLNITKSTFNNVKFLIIKIIGLKCNSSFTKGWTLNAFLNLFLVTFVCFIFNNLIKFEDIFMKQSYLHMCNEQKFKLCNQIFFILQPFKHKKN